MRIVGGEFRGRPLATPRSNSIRPTTDRTREALFNVLAHRYADRLEGVRVLDLFAGTGALGLEAVSRGAAFCMFVEESAEGRGLIRSNVEAFGLTGRTKIFGAMPRVSVRQEPSSPSAWFSPTRPMARVWAKLRSVPHWREGGWNQMRSWSLRRRLPPRLTPVPALLSPTSGDMATQSFV